MVGTNGTVTVASPHGWVRSSRCTPNGNCMEVLVGEETVGLRDSKSTRAGNLFFARHRWSDFLEMVTA